MDTTEFINTFNQFILQLNTVIPLQYRTQLIQVNCLVKVKNERDTMVYFFKILHPFQKRILNQDSSFIHEIKDEFPFLYAYFDLDPNSQKVTLEYLKVLYLLAYHQIENSVALLKKSSSVSAA